MSTITFTEMACVKCATRFSMDDALLELRSKDGQAFYCPNGHGQSYTKSRDGELADARQEIIDLREEIRDANAEVTRLKCELVKAEKPIWKRIL